MKFNKDSIVVIYDSLNEKLTATDFYQMVGRSSRKRGLCIGHILVENDGDMPDELPEAEFYIRTKLVNSYTDDDLLTIETLTELFKTGNPQIKKKIAARFSTY